MLDAVFNGGRKDGRAEGGVGGLGVYRGRLIRIFFIIHTILDQNVQTLLDQEVVIENDKTKGERQNIIAGPDSEKVTQAFLKGRG